MKRLENLSLFASAAAIMLVFAATASASIATSEGSVYTGAIEATSSEGVTFGPMECESSTIKSSIETHGVGITAKGAISKLTFEECTGEWTLTVKSLGSLEFHKTAFFPEFAFPRLSGMTVTLSNHFGTSCHYVPDGEIMGFLFESRMTGSTAEITSVAWFELESGGGLCIEKFQWNGRYTVNTPDNLDVDLT